MGGAKPFDGAYIGWVIGPVIKVVVVVGAIIGEGAII